MHKPYDPQFDGELISEKNCEELTGLHPYELINLTGIFAVVKKESIFFYNIEGAYPIVYLTVLVNKVLIFEMVWDIKEKSIRNELFIVRVPGNKIGLLVFNKQVQESIKEGLNFFTIDAARGTHKDGTVLIGYKVWAKFGYIMTEKSHQKFLEKMAENGRNDISSLQQLHSISDKDERIKAEELWDRVGETWSGIFNLEADSESLVILNDYTTKKFTEDNSIIKRT